ncbi:uncharacterized protein LOC134794513 [Cydia splendana]|uniref:uncharacterized protein LOC134794513 n=1 Tax=Cydia splendana TaxID=1100963 RepID=UPI00300C9F59
MGDGNAKEMPLPMSRNNSLVEAEMLEPEQYQNNELGELEVNGEVDTSRPPKRSYDENQWEIVGDKKGKKVKACTETIEIFISSSEKLPKQFALAKLFKENNITDIQKIKYLNPYKIRVEMSSEINIDKLENSKVAKEKAWRIQRPMEKSLSYGVIRDVDMELTDEEVCKSIQYDKPAELLSAFRLKKRDSNCKEGWSLSEVVRLCFKGTFLPPFVFVDGLRLKVDPYIFPVSQCSRCWKLGHSQKRCPSSRIICPKCGNNHANCETTELKCVNCEGPHISLSRSCPVYLKEKRLRELMAEYNCTYRKALELYVTPESPDRKECFDFPKYHSFPKLKFSECTAESALPSQPTQEKSFAKIVETKAMIHQENVRQEPQTRPTKSKKERSREENNVDTFLNNFLLSSEREENLENDNKQDQKEKSVDFSELVDRLKEIIFLKEVSVQMKVLKVIKCCIQWIILLCVEKLSCWPILKSVMDLFINDNGK